MRIVEYGHIKPKMTKCNHCGAILEYVPNDFKWLKGIYYLTCPICDGGIVKDDNGERFVLDDLK